MLSGDAPRLPASQARAALPTIMLAVTLARTESDNDFLPADAMSE